jgi:hypothetical protein
MSNSNKLKPVIIPTLLAREPGGFTGWRAVLSLSGGWAGGCIEGDFRSATIVASSASDTPSLDTGVEAATNGSSS